MDEMPNVSPVEVQKYLKGVDYPADKDELIETAQNNDAPQEVFNVLDQLDDREYDSPADVSSEIGTFE